MGAIKKIKSGKIDIFRKIFANFIPDINIDNPFQALYYSCIELTQGVKWKILKR